jgi:hypothetical protein
MDINKYHNVLIVTNYGGKIEIRDSTGEWISVKDAIKFLNEVDDLQAEQTGAH